MAKAKKSGKAKTSREALILAMKAIEKEEGEGSVYTLGSKKANLKIERIPTGIEDLDSILGGGIPKGRIIEIFGPESAGKTTLLYHLLGRCGLAVDIPIEGTFDAIRAKIFGNRKGQLAVYRPKYGEQAMERCLQFAKAGVDMVGIDSVPSLIPKEDFERIVEKEDFEKEGRRGGIARLLTNTLPPIESVCEMTGTTVVFVNQVRDKMDAMMFGEKTQTPGGRKLRHACSLRLQVGRKAWIEIPNKDPRNSAKTQKVGMILKVKVAKSKVCNPMGEAELPLFFDRGFVSFDDVQTIRREIMKENNSKYKNLDLTYQDGIEDDDD